MNTVTVTAPCGILTGSRTEWGCEFLGIPYGRADRFAPPEPVSWQGERSCRSYGSKSMQPAVLGPQPADSTWSILGSEDCLNLNVWTPAVSPECPLPVVIYVHGGAFQVGSNSQPERSGDRFIEDHPMIFVSVNYRLGVLGFLPGEKGTGSYNNAMRDLLLAFRWVWENIAAFGGDAEDITLFGISAGAKAIASLMTLPEVRRHCRKLVLESGAFQAFRGRETADFVQDRLLKELPDGADLMELPAEELVLAQAKLSDRAGYVGFYGPVYDEELFHEDWKSRWNDEGGWGGSALLGSELWELAPLGRTLAAQAPERQEETLRDLFGSSRGMAREAFSRLTGPADARWGRVLSDFVYRSPLDAMAGWLLEEGSRVWCYSMEYLPATHGQGFGLLMGQWEDAGRFPDEERRQGARELSERMRRAVRTFILTGQPSEDGSWPLWDRKWKMIWNFPPSVRESDTGSLSPYPESTYTVSKEEN